MSRYRLPAVLFSSAMLVAAAAPHARQATPAPQQYEHQATDKGKPQADMMAKCKAMMAEHQKMMEEMKAADQRLDGLVAKMNAASGQAKVEATAATVAEIVAQRKAMRESMMKMHHGAMRHTGEHLQAGRESMAMCPMMKERGGH